MESSRGPGGRFPGVPPLTLGRGRGNAQGRGPVGPNGNPGPNQPTTQTAGPADLPRSPGSTPHETGSGQRPNLPGLHGNRSSSGDGASSGWGLETFAEQDPTAPDYFSNLAAQLPMGDSSSSESPSASSGTATSTEPTSSAEPTPGPPKRPLPELPIRPLPEPPKRPLPELPKATIANAPDINSALVDRRDVGVSRAEPTPPTPMRLVPVSPNATIANAQTKNSDADGHVGIKRGEQPKRADTGGAEKEYKINSKRKSNSKKKMPNLKRMLTLKIPKPQGKGDAAPEVQGHHQLLNAAHQRFKSLGVGPSLLQKYMTLAQHRINELESPSADEIKHAISQAYASGHLRTVVHDLLKWPADEQHRKVLKDIDTAHFDEALAAAMKSFVVAVDQEGGNLTLASAKARETVAYALLKPHGQVGLDHPAFVRALHAHLAAARWDVLDEGKAAMGFTELMRTDSELTRAVNLAIQPVAASQVKTLASRACEAIANAPPFADVGQLVERAVVAGIEALVTVDLPADLRKFVKSVCALLDTIASDPARANAGRAKVFAEATRAHVVGNHFLRAVCPAVMSAIEESPELAARTALLPTERKAIGAAVNIFLQRALLGGESTKQSNYDSDTIRQAIRDNHPAIRAHLLTATTD